MKSIVSFIIICVFGAIFVACSSNSTPTEKSVLPSVQSGLAQKSQAVSKETWQVDWENTLRDARKEGKVVIYGSPKPAAYAAISEGFKKAFGLDIEVVAGPTAQMMTKIQMEHRAGIQLGDILLVGGSTAALTLGPLDLLARLDPLLIMPEIKDNRVWYKGSLENQFLDPQHYSLIFISSLDTPLARNINLVRPDEINYLDDLLQPKWKDKLLINDPTTTGKGQSSFAMIGKMKGWDFWRAIARQNPTIIRDNRLQMEWLSGGKFPLLVSPSPSAAQEFVNAKAPLAFIRLKGDHYTASSGGVVAVFKNASHPNAAKIFLNYLLSKEGQTLWSKAEGDQSARLDVPTESVDSDRLITPGEIYPALDDWEVTVWREKTNIAEMAREIFGPLLK